MAERKFGRMNGIASDEHANYFLMMWLLAFPGGFWAIPKVGFGLPIIALMGYGCVVILFWCMVDLFEA